MPRQNLMDEIIRKKEIANSDYNLLTSRSITGFYQECEVTQVFLQHLQSNMVSNYYTIINFEEHIKANKRKFITKTPLSINTSYKMGIIQQRITVEDANTLFTNIQAGRFLLEGVGCNIMDPGN